MANKRSSHSFTTIRSSIIVFLCLLIVINVYFLDVQDEQTHNNKRTREGGGDVTKYDTLRGNKAIGSDGGNTNNLDNQIYDQKDTIKDTIKDVVSQIHRRTRT